MLKPFAIFFLAVLFTLFGMQSRAQIYSINTGSILFLSESRLELIKANSNELRGKLDVSKKIFAFTVKMNSFKGFNSPLQREHFNENYLESSHYPDAYFTGKIIEDIDFSKDGEYSIRAKGNLVVHGVTQERIIKTDITVKNGLITIVSNFTVQLSDHNIPIPKIVHEKLASEIKVEVKAVMQKQ
jgi:polyisoprenoid-binding protein YceI